MVLGEWFRDREIEQIVSSGMNVGEITRARAYCFLLVVAILIKVPPWYYVCHTSINSVVEL